MAKAYTELADCGIIDTGAGCAARVKRVKPIPEPLVRAAKTYADEARRLGASLDLAQSERADPVDDAEVDCFRISSL